MHYFPEEEQRKVLKKCVNNLNPNGMIIIREGNKEMVERHKGTRLSEFFSIGLGFNKTNYDKLSFLSRSFIEDFATENNLALKIIDNTKLTSNLQYILKSNYNDKV